MCSLRHKENARHSFTKYFLRIHSDTFTRPIKAGTSTSGPITAAKAWPELMPKTATATAMANSKFTQLYSFPLPMIVIYMLVFKAIFV
jgi:hypothetical protein